MFEHIILSEQRLIARTIASGSIEVRVSAMGTYECFGTKTVVVIV